MSKLSLMILVTASVLAGLLAFSCSSNPTTQAKASSLLLRQIDLRKKQLASPTPQRLAQIRSMGMYTTDIGIQRIYIYLKQQLTQAQITELQALGVNVYLNSWIPPAGNNPDGYYLSDLPVDKLDALAAKDYIIKLDTAERQLNPQPDKP